MRHVTLALALTLPAIVWGQSLGEVARKEKERRKRQESGAAAKQYSDQDLKSGSPATSSEIVVSATPSPSANPAGGSWRPPEAGGNDRRGDEASWRQRMAAARQRIEIARKNYDALKDLYLVPGEVYVDEKNRPVFTNPRQIQSAVKAAKDELEAAEQRLAALEEEARRAGVPPGWLR